MKLAAPEISRIEMIIQGQEDGVSLAQGALRVGGVAPVIHDYASAVLRTDKADYYGPSQGLRDLRAALAAHLSQRYLSPISMAQLLIGHGSMGALSALLLHLLEPGDEVIVPEPCYPVYGSILQMVRAHICGVPAYVRSERVANGRWQFDLSAIESAITEKTKLLLLSNPNNPTGHVLSEKELGALVGLAEQHGFYIIVDEAYEDYVFEGNFRSVLPYTSLSNRVLRTATFSKGYGMSGWRIGHICGPQELVLAASHVTGAVFSSANLIGQYAALEALRHPEILEYSRRMVAAGRLAMLSELKPLVAAGRVSFATPTGGFSVFCKVDGVPDTYDWAHDMVHAVKLAVVPGGVFSPLHKDHIRLCYARELPVVVEGINRLKRYME